MKNTIYIFIVLFFISCNSRNKATVSEDASYFEEANSEIEKISVESDKEVNTDDFAVDIEDIEITTESFQYEEISKQKLQEMYDLLALKKSSPEFSETLNLQLKNYTITIDKFSSSGDIKIQNLELIDEIYPVTDTERKIKLQYDIVSEDRVEKDSVWAVITSTFVLFEGENIISKKVKFSKIEN